MKQFLKQFFGPTWIYAILKIISGIVLFYVSNFIQSATLSVTDYWPTGWPFVYKEVWGPCAVEGSCHTFFILALVADIIFWYIISAATYFGYKKVRKS